jgi:heat shock protein HslJ
LAGTRTDSARSIIEFERKDRHVKLAPRAAALTSGLLLSACMTTAGDRPGATAELVGQEWVVEDIAGRGVIDDARATLLFGQDGRLSGDTSCNRYFADYHVDGLALQIGDAGVTRRACAPAVMDQERRFLDVFNAVTSYRIDDRGALVLSTPAGATMTARAAAITR